MKKSLAFLLVLVMILSFALVGCSNTDEPVNEEEGTEETEANVEETTEDDDTEVAEEEVDNPAKERGNVLTVATASLKGLFNPFFNKR